MKYTRRHLRSWIRSPNHYWIKLRERLFGVNDEFLKLSRDEFVPGGRQWLTLSEIKYGGVRDGVCSGTHKGGDRMSPFQHGYGRCYEDFLKPFCYRQDSRDLLVLEFGILNGSGLAIWCDLFPDARVVGFDINLDNFLANQDFLKEQGAFAQNAPEVYVFDQLDVKGMRETLCGVLNGQMADVVIDDGLHSRASVENTFIQMQDFLSEDFVYFIEDNFDTYDWLAHRYPKYLWTTRGEMTVVRSKQ